MRGLALVLVLVLPAMTASAQPAVDVDVRVDVGVSSDQVSPPPPPHRYFAISHAWTARDGEGDRAELELARGATHHLQTLAAAWTAGVAASRIDERAVYYGHDDEIAAHDTTFTGTFAGALRLGRLETRCGFDLGVERTTGMQTAFERAHAVSRLAPVAEVFAQVSVDVGPFAALMGWRVIAHAQRYDTLAEMDTFTREPTLLAFVGLAAAID